MNIISIRAVDLDDPEIPLRTADLRRAFQPEEAVTDEYGNSMCPICGCCTFKEKSVLNVLGGERKVLVCSSGCTHTKPHRGARAGIQVSAV